jgi:hypothetical protein
MRPILVRICFRPLGKYECFAFGWFGGVITVGIGAQVVTSFGVEWLTIVLLFLCAGNLFAAACSVWQVARVRALMYQVHARARAGDHFEGED